MPNVPLEVEELECTMCGFTDTIVNWYKVTNEKNEQISFCCPKCRNVGLSRFTLKKPCKQCVTMVNALNELLPPTNLLPNQPETQIIERVAKHIRFLEERNKLLELTGESLTTKYDTLQKMHLKSNWGYYLPKHTALEGSLYYLFDVSQAPKAIYFLHNGQWILV